MLGKAAELAAQQGVRRTARALQLDLETLRQLVEGGGELAGSGAAATFLELLSPLAVPAPTDPCECTIEVKSRGSKLRIEVRGLEPTGLAAIIRDFAG